LGSSVFKEDTNIREHGYSWRIEAGEERAPHITVNVEDKTIYDTLSFWIKSNTVEQIDINIKGYNQGNLTYQTTSTHSVKIPDRWELINVELSNEELEEILLEFTSFQSTFWVADLELNTFK